ncbi:MAG: sugar transferase [Rhodobacteraceae bacterium]|nr:sugar transferase [Paracoccaceae bacterium]
MPLPVLHILVADPWFRTPDSAGTTRTFSLVHQLAHAGHAVTVLTTGAALGDVGDLRLPKDVSLCVVPVAESLKFGTPPGETLRTQGGRAARRHLKSIAPIDVAYVTSPDSAIAKDVISICRAREIPYIIDRREPARSERSVFARMAAARALRNAYRVLAATPALRAEVIAQGVDTSHADTSGAGADGDLFTSGPRDTNDFLAARPHLARGPLVVFAGQVTPSRPLGYLLDIAAAMRALAPEVSFVICGDGRERLDLNAHAARLDILERNTWFMTPRPRKELAEVLAAAHVVVAFGDRDHTDTSSHLYDALAAGRAVAVIGDGWQREMIETRQAGVALPADNAEAAARELLDFLIDPDVVMRAGEQAGALGRGRASMTRIGGDIRLALERAAADFPRAAVARRKMLARKRATDVIVSVAALIVLAPIWLLAAIVVAIGAKRWPFVARAKAGIKGRSFMMFGFAPSGLDGVLKRVGLDAIPRLFNVAAGRMSLVGPPPCPPGYVEYLTTAQSKRGDVAPGLTSYCSGDAPPETWEQAFTDDVWYAENLTRALDRKLIGAALVRWLLGRRGNGREHLGKFDEIMARRQGAEDV